MKVKTSRWRSLFFFDLLSFIFPATMTISGGRLTYEKTESVVFFWDKCKDSMSVNKITSFRIDTGIVWDKLVIDTAYDEITIKGIRKSEAKRFYDNFYLIQSPPYAR